MCPPLGVSEFYYLQATFEVLRDWIRELQKLGPPNIILAIAGNKCDLEENREVSFFNITQVFLKSFWHLWSI